MIKQLDFSALTVVLSTVAKPWIDPVFSFEYICTAWNKAVRRNQLLERFRTLFATCMWSEFFFFFFFCSPCSFCVSPMSSNPQYVNELMAMADCIEWLKRRPVTQLYCYHCSNYQNSSDQFQILIGMNLKRCLNVYIMLGYGSVCIACYMREEFLWTNELNCHFFIHLILCQYSSQSFCMGLVYPNKLMNWLLCKYKRAIITKVIEAHQPTTNDNIYVFLTNCAYLSIVSMWFVDWCVSFLSLDPQVSLGPDMLFMYNIWWVSTQGNTGEAHRMRYCWLISWWS